jgi:2-polyprenyl-3-methyl-5-hydroxy-6-metoxy-1,4-benzoquinol methylase
MSQAADLRRYPYRAAEVSHTLAYLRKPVLRLLSTVDVGNVRVLEIGCGNGYFATELSRHGFNVTAIDPSSDGIEIAKRAGSSVEFMQAAVQEVSAETLGTFGVVISLEVIEHVYAPRQFVARIFELLQPNGLVVLSTPYHGYLKNLALSLTGMLDSHFTALWDHGHIKFWSIRTLTALLSEAGFLDIRFKRVGRIPPLSKSMIAVARRPAV